ncbi:4-alpha-glucanotransferase [Cyanobium sp. NIES-981]|uniref:4-alpha-glucanotransferase n=1 Tax=Cyanobium sp. NIES-981 TaxID=1851505 RepID=UPI0007DE18CE|nr:4-alpha-glucanotransferase [Cyanobium sp. NIES-981]SBO42911.1 4-alpha-glucanotransferase [Cyanobium sp. NIES-981]
MNHPHAPARRRCGVLLHPTALPGPGPCGTFGAAARDWIDLLARHRIGLWQLLPLAPTDSTGSPYSSPSGSALNPWLLDGDLLEQEGFLRSEDLQALPVPESTEQVDLELMPRRAAALAAALARRWPDQSAASHAAFAAWSRRQRSWLPDHCRYMVLRDQEGGRPWWQWPRSLALRDRACLRQLDRTMAGPLLEQALLQWQLQRQWEALRAQAHRCDVDLVGDLPFYVAHDSTDVWCHPELFSLNRDGSLVEQSGVPPDYFSATGQLWGTPVYRWSRHLRSGFRWWLARLGRQFELFDRLRLDHFRALQAYWSVPGGDDTAQNGRWCPSPGTLLLGLLWIRCRLKGQLRDGRLPLIAEDLGVITPAVEALRDRFALPGMKILQFAFNGDDDNPYLPANIQGPRWVVYTGTHDNATTTGWWQGLGDEERRRVEQVLGVTITSPAWQLLEAALATEAELAVAPVQDLLERDDSARFNTPGTSSGNWTWRLTDPIASLDGPIKGLGEMARHHQRC